MRTVLTSDLLAVARTLRGAPPACRSGMCQAIISGAEVADRFVKRRGLYHPLWGNGTLTSAARAFDPSPDWPAGEFEFLSCLLLVLDALVAHKAELQRVSGRTVRVGA